MLEGGLEVLHVGGEAVHQLTRAVLVEERDVLQHYLLEQILAHPRGHLLAHATQQVDVDESEARLEHVETQQIAGRLANVLHEGVVDRVHHIGVGVARQPIDQIPQQIGYADIYEGHD